VKDESLRLEPQLHLKLIICLELINLVFEEIEVIVIMINLQFFFALLGGVQAV
jgi:hypothetical protein